MLSFSTGAGYAYYPYQRSPRTSSIFGGRRKITRASSEGLFWGRIGPGAPGRFIIQSEAKTAINRAPSLECSGEQIWFSGSFERANVVGFLGPGMLGRHQSNGTILKVPYL